MGMVMGRTQARRLRFFKRLARVAVLPWQQPHRLPLSAAAAQSQQERLTPPRSLAGVDISMMRALLLNRLKFWRGFMF
jgi:hypothetical protein